MFVSVTDLLTRMRCATSTSCTGCGRAPRRRRLASRWGRPSTTGLTTSPTSPTRTHPVCQSANSAIMRTINEPTHDDIRITQIYNKSYLHKPKLAIIYLHCMRDSNMASCVFSAWVMSIVCILFPSFILTPVTPCRSHSARRI